MLARAVLFAALLASTLYGIGWVATTTPYFKDRQRKRRIFLRATLVLASIVLTVTTLAVIVTVERH
jgi:heme/copper-type cytochrome/quinol oxidase subunit 2